MAIRTFKLFNVVKQTDNEMFIRKYKALGYEEITEAKKETPKKTAQKTK